MLTIANVPLHACCDSTGRQCNVHDNSACAVTYGCSVGILNIQKFVVQSISQCFSDKSHHVCTRIRH